MKLQIIFLILSLILCILSFFFKKTKFNKIEEKIEKNYKYIGLFLLIIVIFSSFYQLNSIPNLINIDEAGMATDAWSISKYHVDRHLKAFPTYLINFGGGQSAMLAYLVSIVMKLLGNNIISIRLPLVILRVLSFIACYFMMKKAKKPIHGLFFLLIISVCPYFIMQSRFGLDCNLFAHFLIIATCFFYYALLNEKKRYYLISGLLYGLSFYTYILSSIVIPIFITLILAYCFYLKKINKKQLICFLVPILILWIPFILLFLINKGYLNEINGIITIPKLYWFRSGEISLKNIPHNFYIFRRILTYDKQLGLIYQNAIPRFGTLYYFSIPFTIIGFIVGCINLFKSIRVKEIHLDTIMMLCFISISICALIISDPNISKLNAIFFPLAYITALGIKTVSKKININIIVIILLYFVSFAIFMNYYLHDYNKDNKENNYFVRHDYTEALRKIEKTKYDTIYIESVDIDESIYLFRYYHINPYHFSEKYKNYSHELKGKTYHFKIENIENKGVYIVYNDWIVKLLKKKNYKYDETNNYYIFYNT